MTEVIFNHSDFLIINKPCGITMHDAQAGVVQQVQSALGESGLHLVHRLDDGTSGCLILARNARAAANFEVMFRQHQIQKYYLALVEKKPKKKQGTVMGDMKNRRNGQHILLKTKTNPAITQFFSYGFADAPRMMLVKPLSGKTHQIRVAMKSLGSPIVGDTLYGAAPADRLYLHAWGLDFDYQGESVNVFCQPPAGEYFLQPPIADWLACAPAPQTLNWPKTNFKFEQNNVL
ncbi:TIGR01621 family pseudouridine synthase [Alteromonas lipolytica]|uniref:RNA pseudouridine synthase n=1 Tax=Alteromonas lipolytica TaxID=1856405 RepID=A0A1E8FJ35_9ALTE|nr:TIGR01621 family pseudouridine synthase [Alteromonas lipolytica]OFI35934.1 RNA pseudouridine synthase [Alteromonas lipolytica]GGF72443.1 RNA pseudouridine synthase [Alteromonas lipolytica]